MGVQRHAYNHSRSVIGSKWQSKLDLSRCSRTNVDQLGPSHVVVGVTRSISFPTPFFSDVNLLD